MTTRRARLILIGVAGILPVSMACSDVRATSARALPYYADADLTPQWSPVAHRIAPFSMLAQNGATLTAQSLVGRLHVASFIYTRCGAICPTIVRHLSRVQAAIGDVPDVSLVSFTVTPDTDTPAVLAAFGSERGIDPARWRLVTGDRAEIYRLARESYFADDPRTLPQGMAAGEAFLHTEKILLVDRDLRVRGVYNGTAAFDIDKLIEDIHLLRAAR